MKRRVSGPTNPGACQLLGGDFDTEVWCTRPVHAPVNFKKALGDCRGLEGRAQIIARLLAEVHGDVVQTERVLSAVATAGARCLTKRVRKSEKKLAEAHTALGKRGFEASCSTDIDWESNTTELSKRLRKESVEKYWKEMDDRVKAATAEHFGRGWHEGVTPLLNMDAELPLFDKACPVTIAAMDGMSSSARHERRKRVDKRRRSQNDDDDDDDDHAHTRRAKPAASRRRRSNADYVDHVEMGGWQVPRKAVDHQALPRYPVLALDLQHVTGSLGVTHSNPGVVKDVFACARRLVREHDELPSLHPQVWQ